MLTLLTRLNKTSEKNVCSFLNKTKVKLTLFLRGGALGMFKKVKMLKINKNNVIFPLRMI